jgi:hypothetical protein
VPQPLASRSKAPLPLVVPCHPQYSPMRVTYTGKVTTHNFYICILPAQWVSTSAPLASMPEEHSGDV